MNANYSDNNTALSALYGAHLETVKARHDHALEQAGASHAVIYSGNPKIAFLDDYHFPFKANPHFVSWLPLTEMPHCYLIYTPGETPLLQHGAKRVVRVYAAQLAGRIGEQVRVGYLQQTD